jgi:hypothetical protein
MGIRTLSRVDFRCFVAKLAGQLLEANPRLFRVVHGEGILEPGTYVLGFGTCIFFFKTHP